MASRKNNSKAVRAISAGRDAMVGESAKRARADAFASMVMGRRAKRASVNQLRKDYCLARDRYDEIGRELGRMTGVHKMPRFKHRTVKCRVRASR